MAIMAIVLAVLLPQFRVIQNSWDTKAGTFEALQNGRVLIDHIHRNLITAARITAVSGPSDTNGYIEFIDNDANNVRYDIGANNYVEFGLVGNLYELAGPVSRLQFTCYDGNDFTAPVTDVNSIRFIKVQTTLTNPANLDQDMAFSTNAYIRTNAFPGSIDNITKLSEPWLEFDTSQGMEPALAQIDANHYLCAYRGPGDDGLAVVLTVDTGTWNVSKETVFEYDEKKGIGPALAKIDQTHYLCAYQGENDDGWVRILKVDTVNWTISEDDNLEFDQDTGKNPSLIQIDQTHYLCVYTGPGDDGWAVVLSTNSPSFDSISKKTPFEFDTSKALSPALSQINTTHYLCSYNGDDDDGWAVVLTVNTGTWAISKGAPLEFDNNKGQETALAKIDSNHYLCVYSGPSDDGWATVLTVNTDTWAITNQTPFQFDTTCVTPALAFVDNTHYLCSYTGPSTDGWAVVLTVDTDNWTVSKGTPIEFDTSQGTSPTLTKIYNYHYLCAYTGSGDDGYTGVLGVSEEIRP